MITSGFVMFILYSGIVWQVAISSRSAGGGQGSTGDAREDTCNTMVNTKQVLKCASAPVFKTLISKSCYVFTR